VRRITITYHITADPDTSGRISIFEIPGGRSFKHERTEIHFPVATYGELQLAFYRGAEKVMPYEGFWVGDNTVITDESTVEWGPNTTIELYYNNTSTTDTHEAFIVITGVLEG